MADAGPRTWVEAAEKLEGFEDVADHATVELGRAEPPRVLRFTMKPFLTQYADSDARFAEDIIQSICDTFQGSDDNGDTKSVAYFEEKMEAAHSLKGGLASSGWVEASQPAFAVEVLAKAIIVMLTKKKLDTRFRCDVVDGLKDRYTLDELQLVFPLYLECMERRMKMLIDWFEQKVRPLLAVFKEAESGSEYSDS